VKEGHSLLIFKGDSVEIFVGPYDLAFDGNGQIISGQRETLDR
jgi:hypothetical protein